MTIDPPARTAERSPPDTGQQRRITPIDLERLADRVYQLMRAEIRLEQARSGGPRSNKK